jgi:DNA helicase HerA-like ATPase
LTTGGILLGGGGADYAAPQVLPLALANRHGLIAGATGTGKTVTLQIMAEAFSAAGVPVLLADVKGDLGGLCMPGSPDHKAHPALIERAARIGLDGYAYAAAPTVFWDVFGEQGHPLRTTPSEMGPLLLSRLMELSEAQEGVLNVAFRLADEEGLPILDLKDLRALLAAVGERAGDLSRQYGYVSPASVGAIQRRLLVLENQGADRFFGEPALALGDLLGVDAQGRGRVNVLAADRLMQAPRLYATVLLWLLSELFEELPEIGDPDKPVLALFLDEAHLLFDDAPGALIDRIEQVARLIRSKGVGVYFVTQNPADIPDTVLGQLGNRIQHALRAYTPREAQALRVAAQTFRPNPAFDTAEILPQLGTGEALVSTLGRKGVPGIVERTLIRPPSSRLGPATAEARAAALAASPLAGRYETAIDRVSAFEMLAVRMGEAAAGAETDAGRHYNRARRYSPDMPDRPSGRAGRRTDSVSDAFMKSMARSLGSATGRRLVRGVLGSLFRGR